MAMVTPLLGSLLIGMVDISRAYSAKLMLEQSAYRAIEKVQGYQTTDSTYNTLKSEAVSAAQAAGFTNVSASDVTIDYWLECDGTRQADYTTSCTTGQTYARWVTIDIAASFTPMFSSRRWPGANANGTFTLHGKAGLRTQ
jgi:Flp pilus assembly protein TadG